MRKTLTINTTSPTGQNNKINFSYINPSVTDNDLYNFAMAVMNLTQDTFVKAELTTVTEIEGD